MAVAVATTLKATRREARDFIHNLTALKRDRTAQKCGRHFSEGSRTPSSVAEAITLDLGDGDGGWGMGDGGWFIEGISDQGLL
jgi:hypothetical protein